MGFRKKKLKDAQEIIESYLASNTGPEAEFARATILLGDIRKKRFKLDEAISAYMSVPEKWPTHGRICLQALFKAGQIHRSRKDIRNVKLVVEQLQRFAANDQEKVLVKGWSEGLLQAETPAQED